ncbi:MAG TPA: MBOAT family O-acyltransferase [Acidimicrobiia bacterium]|nr:MBOAT family O-acyltransferase [Acidimicrobiia bacterium]
MPFPTVTFAIFFVVVMITSWLLRPHLRIWKWWLLTASWIFYAWWDWRFVMLLAAMIGITHLAAAAMDAWPGSQRTWLAAGIGADLAILVFFKYYGFFVTSLLELLRLFGLTPQVSLFEVILPIGISFYTFESIAYLVERRRGVVERLALLDLVTYLSFFPKLLSGPITRASEFSPQLSQPSTAYELDGSTALWLLGRGLFKKVVIASYLATAITDGVFTTPGQYSSLEVLAGIYGYTALIYVDFSSYTDMARGLAMLLGFNLPENFRSPYIAMSIREFWTRWHMTLSRWLRDFLFQPMVLSGSRGRVARMRNLMVVMLLAGLWHGPSWTFVLWGGIHGAGLVWERLRRERRRAQGRKPIPVTAWVRLRRRFLTLQFVAFAWVFFRADSVAAAFDVFAQLASFGPAPSVTPLLIMVVASVFAIQYFPEGWSAKVHAGFRRIGPVLQAVTLGGLLVVVDALGPEGVPEFIYTRF